MGAFNTVTTGATCPRCAAFVVIPIQFKYGDTFQHDYRLGDTLRWAGNDVGRPGHALVVADAVAGAPCPSCGYQDDWDLVVVVRRDRIASVEGATGAHDFAESGCSYIVLENDDGT